MKRSTSSSLLIGCLHGNPASRPEAYLSFPDGQVLQRASGFMLVAFAVMLTGSAGVDVEPVVAAGVVGVGVGVGVGLGLGLGGAGEPFVTSIHLFTTVLLESEPL